MPLHQTENAIEEKMSNIMTNDPSRLAGFLYSLNKDPQSWDGWQALHLNWIGPDGSSCMDAVKRIIHMHLGSTDSFIYILQSRAILIVCKIDNEKQVSDALMQSLDVILNNSHALPSYESFNLALSAGRICDSLQNTYGSSLYAPRKAEEKSLEPAEEPETGIPFMAHKVLLVEDDPVTRWQVRSALKESCHLATAQTANRAFAMMQSFRPDLVFLDINLPDKNGHAVLKWILDHDPGARVIMFSSQSDFNTLTNFMNEGASGFIAKPFQKEKLLHYVHRL